MATQITERESNGERILDLQYMQLVASKSQPGTWYELRDGTCSCKGYEYRKTCRHLAAVAELRKPVAKVLPKAPTGKAALRMCSLDD